MQGLYLEQEIDVIKPEMPFYSGFRRIAFGIVFVMLTFRLNNFDVFVDFIGYLLINSGLNRLKPYTADFSKAARSNRVLLFLSVLKIMTVKVKIKSGILLYAPVFMSNYRPENGLGIILFILSMLGLIQIIFEWHFYLHFFRGLKEIALSINTARLGFKASRMWAWIRFWLVSYLLIIITFFIPDSTVTVVLFLFAFNILLLIGLLILLYRFGHLPVNNPTKKNDQG